MSRSEPAGDTLPQFTPGVTRDEPLALGIWASWLEGAFLAVEAHSVVALRVAAIWVQGPTAGPELMRMVAEKPPAFAASGLAATISAFGGNRADQVAAAALRPLRAEATANALRLMDRR